MDIIENLDVDQITDKEEQILGETLHHVNQTFYTFYMNYSFLCKSIDDGLIKIFTGEEGMVFWFLTEDFLPIDYRRITYLTLV